MPLFEQANNPRIHQKVQLLGSRRPSGLDSDCSTGPLQCRKAHLYRSIPESEAISGQTAKENLDEESVLSKETSRMRETTSN